MEIMDGAKVKLIDFFLDKESCIFSININLFILISIIILTLLIRYFIKKYKKSNSIDKDIQLVKLKYTIAGTEFEYDILRNYQNIEIAHKIYIELITRKAAIEIDENKDVITEIYNSWYTLFQITRDELKTFNGKLLKENNTSQELVKLLTDILNKGLRPHLTEYQSRFRKWYDEQLENNNKSPQEIQRDFEDFNELIISMKDVNKSLIDYAKQLNIIIIGKKNGVEQSA